MPHPQGYLLRAYRNLPKKARSGIYAGKHVDVVNRVSREYEVRSRKLVKPNVQKVLLYSQALGQKIRLPVTTAALRAIEQAGGLDRYLLNTPDSLLQSDKASNLKFKLSNIYWYKQHEQKQQQRQGQQGYNPQQGQQQASQQSVLTAVKAAQRQVLTAGGSCRRPQVGWNSQRGTLLPPAAAAAAAAAAGVPSQHS